MDDKPPLRGAIEDLHAELANASAEPGRHEDVLSGLRRDTRALLDRDDDEPTQEHRSLGQQLHDAIPLFEVSHPQLTAAMMQVVDALNRIGI